jgi:hypothetical protein
VYLRIGGGRGGAPPSKGGGSSFRGGMALIAVTCPR